jgi:23S rRNA (uracil1939-C5)-methyltransferase
MALGDIFEAEVERIAAGGAGIARPEGQVFFIPYTAPGDRIRARITADRGSWGEAELEELIEASPRRTTPRCPLYPAFGRGGAPACGGCTLQHLNYESQLEVKAGILRETFIRIAHVPLDEFEIFPSPPWEYRNRVQLHRYAGPENTGERPGFKSARSGRVVPLEDCPAADPGIRSLLKSGDIRIPPGRNRFTLYSREGMVLQEGGLSRGRVKIRDRELLMDAGVFFQSNGTMLELLIDVLLDLAGKAGGSLPLADLYCGVGTFASFLGPRFSGAELLEENPAALDLARKNVREGAYFFASTDNEWVKKKNTAGPAGGGGYGLIIADPPRKGLSPAMRRWLVRCSAPLLAYLSCDPASLARDYRSLSEGWELTDLKFFDFYPQTAHIETLALFRNKYGG